MKGRPPSPQQTDRENFLWNVMRADGQLVAIKDAVMALLTALDIEALARRSGQPRDLLIEAAGAAGAGRLGGSVY